MVDQKKYTKKLDGQRVLIVGGSSGIGYGVAEASLEYGASVIISSSQQSRVEEAVASLQKSYPLAKDRVTGYVCNLSQEDKLEANVNGLLERVGIVDHIVHTAGDPLPLKPLQDVSLEDLKQGGMVRFFASFLIVKTAYANKHLKPGPSSSVTLTTGAISQRPRQGLSISSSYAGGLHSMTRSLAIELKPVRVNLISPGPVDTSFWNTMTPQQRDSRFTELGERLPTGRVGQVEDLVHAYLFVMQDQNCTGSVVDSNSGMLLV